VGTASGNEYADNVIYNFKINTNHWKCSHL